MRNGMVGFLVVLCCGALFAGGCAKKEMVKGEEAMPAAAPTKAVEQAPAKEAPAQPAEKVAAEPIKEAPIAKEVTPAAPAAVQEQTLTRIHFDFDSYVLTKDARDILARDADLLLKQITGKVTVEGHCDERGSDEYNLALGEKRAKAAMNYLVTLGIPADRLSVISYGKEKPLDPGHDEAAWAQNRRAEFVVTK
jgi:peptidoglycan-associated lipoprotein